MIAYKKYVIDGQLTAIAVGDDVNKDGKISAVEYVNPAARQITEINQPTETAEAMKILNASETETDTNLNKIDMNANIDKYQACLYQAWDSMGAMGFLTKKSRYLTLTGKRLSVSIGAKGRNDGVAVATGVREHKENTGVFGKIRGMFKKDEVKAP